MRLFFFLRRSFFFGLYSLSASLPKRLRRVCGCNCTLLVDLPGSLQLAERLFGADSAPIAGNSRLSFVEPLIRGCLLREMFVLNRILSNIAVSFSENRRLEVMMMPVRAFLILVAVFLFLKFPAQPLRGVFWSSGYPPTAKYCPASFSLSRFLRKGSTSIFISVPKSIRRDGWHRPNPEARLRVCRAITSTIYRHPRSTSE